MNHLDDLDSIEDEDNLDEEETIKIEERKDGSEPPLGPAPEPILVPPAIVDLSPPTLQREPSRESNFSGIGTVAASAVSPIIGYYSGYHSFSRI